MKALPFLAALLAAAFVRAAAAELPLFDERFKGIPLDRCKDIGGPPTWVKEGARVVSLSAGEGRRNDVVVITAENFDPGRGDEVHFLLKGLDVKAPADFAGARGFRVRVPDMGALRGKQSGWVYLLRGNVRGKATPFQFLPDAPGPGGGPAPGEAPPAR